MDALFKQQFSDFNEAETELHKSTKAARYSLVIHTKKPSAANFHTVNFRCAKGRSFTPKKTLAHESKRRKTSTQMTSCPYKLIVQKLSRSSENSKWNITRGTLDKAAEHNHPPNNPAAFPKYRKHAIQRKEAEIISRYKAGASPHIILAELRSDVDPEVQLISRQDVNNLLYTRRQIELCGKTHTAWLYEELEKSQDYWYKDLRDDYN